MDILFSELKKKDVYDSATGKKLGKITDLKFGFPSGKISAVTVGCGLLGMGETKIVPFIEVEKIGEDAVFIRTKRGSAKPDFCPPEKKDPCASPCPPNPCPPMPPCPPKPPCPPCEPNPCPPNPCPPKPPFPPQDDDNCLPPHMGRSASENAGHVDLRLDLDDYE